MQLTDVNNKTTQYRYDESGNRVYKYNSSINEFYFVDPSGKELASYDLVSKRLKSVNLYGNDMIGRVNVTWDIEPVNPVRWDERFYYIKDHLGNNRFTIDTTGVTVMFNDYTPFGGYRSSRETGGIANNRFSFTGKERDRESSYDYFGARYYDSELGRWLSIDPLADQRPGLSPYNYCQNNPLSRIDPNGMIDWLKVGLGTLNVIGGISESISGFGLAAGTSVSGVGALGGVALGIHGLGTASFGIVEMTSGFIDDKTNISSGLTEAIGKGVDQISNQHKFENIGNVIDNVVSMGSTDYKQAGKAINHIIKNSIKNKNVSNKSLITILKKSADIGLGVLSAENISENIKKEKKEDNNKKKDK